MALVALAFDDTAHAQAYCALRDPAPQIYSLYADADGYRSSVGRIDEHARSEVGDRLPFTLHTRELGQHTLYVALADTRRLGFVHVRSEPSDWGIVEVAWAIGLDGRIRDFRLQRCRGGVCREIEQSNLRTILAGRGPPELRALLASDNSALAAGVPLDAASPNARRLAAVLVRSAAKTLAVTDVVWGPELRGASASR
jgi:hypothetical protein